jgi:6-phosphogluconolactonase
MTPTPRLVVVLPDAETLADSVAARLLTFILDTQSVRRPVHVGLTGGTIGVDVLAAAAASPLVWSIDWSGVHFWWGDERYLPSGDPERNETAAREALLDHLAAQCGLPEANVHAIAGPDASASAEGAAEEYSSDLAGVTMDVLLLGMGHDGHVASLFPCNHAVTVTGTAAVAVHDSPKPPATRVSLTFEAINASREAWLVVAGEGKAEAVAGALAGDPMLPASYVRRPRTLWLLDTAAGDAA